MRKWRALASMIALIGGVSMYAGLQIESSIQLMNQKEFEDARKLNLADQDLIDYNEAVDDGNTDNAKALYYKLYYGDETDSELRYKSIHNLATMIIERVVDETEDPKALSVAVNLLREALIINPESVESKHNLELALRIMSAIESFADDPAPNDQQVGTGRGQGTDDV